MPQPTIVLVHGAWADASSWNPVATELQSQGFTVLAPPNLLRSVSVDAPYITSFIAQRTSGPVVLVGHSYGGFVITNAAAGAENVKALVYVDAFIPDEGASRSSPAPGRPSTSPIRPRSSTSSATRARPRVTSRRSSSPPPCTTRSPRTSPRPTAR